LSTEPRRAPDARGFTLIEVLIAMVILAIGLLALQALGVGASRMVARAERRSAYTAIATREIEAALSSVRETGTAVTRSFNEYGAAVSVTTASSPLVGAIAQRQRFDVTVQVTPESPRPASDSVRLVGSVVR